VNVGAGLPVQVPVEQVTVSPVSGVPSVVITGAAVLAGAEKTGSAVVEYRW
jgi:hypothetical protein